MENEKLPKSLSLTITTALIYVQISILLATHNLFGKVLYEILGMHLKFAHYFFPQHGLMHVVVAKRMCKLQVHSSYFAQNFTL